MKTIEFTTKIFKRIVQLLVLCAISPLIPAIGLMWIFAWLEQTDSSLPTSGPNESAKELIPTRCFCPSPKNRGTASVFSSRNPKVTAA